MQVSLCWLMIGADKPLLESLVVFCPRFFSAQRAQMTLCRAALNELLGIFPAHIVLKR